MVAPDDAARERGRDRRDRAHFLVCPRLVALVLDGHVDEPRVTEALGRAAARGDQLLPLESRRRRETILVERFGGELADLRMQAARLMQEQAALRLDRLRAAQEVLERRCLRAGRMARLLRLLELLRIAEQHEALGRR